MSHLQNGQNGLMPFGADGNDGNFVDFFPPQHAISVPSYDYSPLDNDPMSGKLE